MPQTRIDWRQRVQDELSQMNVAVGGQQRNYHFFLKAAQAFDWEGAQAYALNVSSYTDAALDAFMRACRAIEEGARGA